MGMSVSASEVGESRPMCDVGADVRALREAFGALGMQAVGVLKE